MLGKVIKWAGVVLVVIAIVATELAGAEKAAVTEAGAESGLAGTGVGDFSVSETGGAFCLATSAEIRAPSSAERI